jgi:hypothetical protein
MDGAASGGGLTSTEKASRSQWLHAIHMTMQLVSHADDDTRHMTLCCIQEPFLHSGEEIIKPVAARHPHDHATGEFGRSSNIGNDLVLHTSVLWRQGLSASGSTPST